MYLTKGDITFLLVISIPPSEENNNYGKNSHYTN